MNKIDWTNFNGEKFQNFCNALLSFEVSKNFIPFSAPGKDSGIDGWYEGEYNGKSGKWRFQSKFHSPDTGRTPGFNQLVKEVKKEIVANVKDENNLILITNIEINPNQRKKIEKVVNESISAHKLSALNFELWDGAKLNTLLTRHSLVAMWYLDDFKVWLQDYKEYFKDQLDEKVNTGYTLSNQFYYREEDTKFLNDFIENNSKLVCLITGEAGIGKTRLCIEYFENRLKTKEEWIALVMVSHRLNLDKIRKALSGDKNYVVLFDDAEKFEERDIADLIQVLKSHQPNKVKLIFTTRKYFSDEIFQQLKTYDNDLISSHELTNFTSTQVIEILQSELRGYTNLNAQINSLVEITYGKPILVMTLINAIKNGTQINKIKKDEFLKKYVTDYFKQFSVKLSQVHEFSVRDIKEIIDRFTLIEPVKIEDEVTLDLLCSGLEITKPHLKIILNEMRNQGVISGYYEFSIKPDIYSDILLKEAATNVNWINETTPLFAIYISKIIKNLSNISDAKGNQDTKILDTLLDWFVSQIDSAPKTGELSKIMDTIYYISYERPEIAEKAINKFISIFSNDKHLLHKSFFISPNAKNYSLDSILNTVNSILAEISFKPGYRKIAFDFAKEIYSITSFESIVTAIFGYSKTDFLFKYKVTRQTEFVEYISAEIHNGGQISEFSLKAINEMLKLEHTGFESKPFKSREIVITTYYVPENSNVSNLRADILKILFQAYKNCVDRPFKDKILNVILQIPPSILSTRKGHKYSGVSELSSVINFIKEISDDNIELGQKQIIKEKIYWYKKWNIGEQFHSVIDEITKKLSQGDLAEELISLFNPRFDGKIKNEESIITKRLSEIIGDYSAIEIAESLIKVVKESPYTPHYLFPFLNQIAIEDSKKAKEFINHLWSANIDFVINFGSTLFHVLYFEQGDIVFVREYFIKLRKLNRAFADNCILLVYNSYRSKDSSKIRSQLSKYDYDLIEEIIQINNPENQYHISSALPVLLLVDSKRAIKTIQMFLSQSNLRDMEHLFSILTIYQAEFFDEIKWLALKATYRFAIPYHFEAILNGILKKEGYEDILKYIIARIKYKKERIKKDKSYFSYEVVPSHPYGILYKDVSENIKIDLFNETLNWYCKNKFDSMELFFSHHIIEYFSPSKEFTLEIKAIYDKLINSESITISNLKQLANSLKAFEHKNEIYGDTVISILKKGNNLKSKDYNSLESECYIAITDLGVKSGTPGEPFSVDLELKELLLILIDKYRGEEFNVREFLKKTLNSVERDIASSIDERKEEEW